MRFTLPVAFATVVFVLTAGLLPIVDPDFFWHVKTGEVIREIGALPSFEIFSHTAHGLPWVVQGWLADVILDQVWESAGVTGIRLLVGSLFVCTWAVIYRTVRIYLVRPATALLVSGLSVALMLPALAPRPTMATTLFLSLTLFSLIAFRCRGESRWLLILPPLFALWPNLHFGYVTGLGLIALFLLSDVLGIVLPIAREHLETGSLLGRSPALILLLCVVAIGANPHGYGVLWETAHMVLTNSGSRVSEWHSPAWGDATGKLVYSAICIVVIARSFARRTIHWLDIIVPLAVIGAGLSAVRHVSLMGIILTPFVARAIVNWEVPVFVVKNRDSTGFSDAATRDVSERTATLVNIVFVACAVAVVIFLSPLADRKFGKLGSRLQPSGAADFLLAHNLKGDLFNTYNGGGYLIYRLYPHQQVFIDGRYNPYPKKVIDDYFLITDGKPRWFDTLQSYGIDIVLAETDSSFRQLMLLRKEFRLVYEDRYYSVLVRDSDQFQSLSTVEPATE